MRRLIDQRVLITGAGSGLGRALAQRYAAAGWRVACTDLRADAAHETAERIRAAGGIAWSGALDVRSEDAFAEVVAAVLACWGGIDVLVNNAGVATAGTVADAPLEQWRFVLDINLLGCVRGVRAVLPAMRAQGGGHLVNVASFAGYANPPALASYSASKAAVISLSETLRFELAAEGIGVSVIAPSFFKTGLLDSGRGEVAADVHSRAPQMDTIVRKLMDKATVHADDVAEAVFRAVLDDRFLVLPHADARARLRLKRWLPALYHRLACRATAAFLRPPAEARRWRRTSKGPLADSALDCQSSASTCAAGGPSRRKACSPARAAGPPQARPSTRPSGRLATQPDTPSRWASRRVDSRK